LPSSNETQPVMKENLSQANKFKIFESAIYRVLGKLVSNGQISYNVDIKATKALMYENQMRLFNLKGEFNE